MDYLVTLLTKLYINVKLLVKSLPNIIAKSRRFIAVISHNIRLLVSRFLVKPAMLISKKVDIVNNRINIIDDKINVVNIFELVNIFDNNNKKTKAISNFLNVFRKRVLVIAYFVDQKRVFKNFDCV